MFDFGIGTPELALIAIVAIIVVGPKDLPKLLRTVGQFFTKVRGMAREFQGYLDEAARETGIDDMKKEVSKMTDFDLNETLDTPSESKSGTKSDSKTGVAEPTPKTDFDPVEEGNKAAKATVEAVRAKDAAAAAKAKAVTKTAKKTAKKPAKKSAKAKA